MMPIGCGLQAARLAPRLIPMARLLQWSVAGLWVLSVFGCDRSAVPVSAERARVGVDCNYLLDMARHGKGWSDGSRPADPMVLLAGHGCNSARIRLWVGDDGTNKLTYATRTALRAQQAGLKPYLVLFLSEEWADFVKQPAPKAWRGLSSAKKLATIEAYARRVTRHMAAGGVRIDTYEIGNEIDFGICGEFEEQWSRRVSVAYMSRNVWPRMMPIIKAAQAGVLKGRPDAKFVLHLTQWNNVEYCIALWRAMLAAGVRIDYAGLSYFPSSSRKPEERSLAYLRAQAAKVVAAVHRPVLICETGYPAQARFGGQFSSWNHPAAGYALSDEGQAKWIAALVAMVRSDRNFAGVYYWSPEWYGGGLWDVFALFDSGGVARPGVRSFEQPCGAVRIVAFGAHSVVPVVKRRGRILDLDGLEPRVLSRRLIEVSVDANGLGGRSFQVRTVPSSWFGNSGTGTNSRSFSRNRTCPRISRQWRFWRGRRREANLLWSDACKTGAKPIVTNRGRAR